MESTGWHPMEDEFYDKTFNSYELACADKSSDVVDLFIAGIPSCLTEQGLRNFMSPVAKILRVELKQDRNFGFVTVFRNDAVKIIAYFNNYELGGRRLTVKRSRPKQQNVQASGTGQKETTSNSATRPVHDLVIPPLQYPTAAKHVQVGQVLDVKILNVISPSQFWICCNLHDADDKLQELHTQMQKHYSNLPPKAGFKPTGSGLYAAPKGDSGSWCRAQALNFDTESVSVLLLDYGTCQRASLTNLHSLEGQFCSLPFQAICCSLAHLQRPAQWNEDSVNCMRQLLSSEQVHAKVCGIDGYILSVELILSSGKTVNNELVSRNCASYVDGFEPSSVQTSTPNTAALDSACKSESPEAGCFTEKDLPHAQLTVGGCYDVVVLHVRNASEATVCLKSNVNELSTLITELNSYEASESYIPHVGELVAAQYANDSCCYRAKVLSLDNDSTATVLFLDYGNTATVKMNSLIQLQPRHIDLPVFGISVKFTDSNVSRELLAEYSSLKLRIIERHRTHYVVSLAEDDMTMHCAENPPDGRVLSMSDVKSCCLEVGKTYKAYVTDASDVENFFVHVEECHYEAVDTQLQMLYSDKPGGYVPQQTGELIVVHLDVWYRAVVKELENEDAVKCQLIDFGMCVTASSKDISRFHPELLAHPVVAFKCSFHDAVASKTVTWKDDYLHPMADVYKMTVVEIKGDMHFVELIHIESNVDYKQMLMDDGLLMKASSSNKQSLVSPTARDDSTTKSSSGVIKTETLLPSLSDTEVRRLFHNLRERIVVVHAISPSDFYIQPAAQSFQENLESLQQSINTFCRQSNDVQETVAVGDIVGVLHEDGVWYRGEVVNLESHNKFQVHFVDFGFSKIAESAQLRTLPDALAVSLPRQAVHCAIDRAVGREPDGGWSDAVIERFRNFCASRDLTLNFIFKDDASNMWMVDLLRAGIKAKDVLSAQPKAKQQTSSVATKIDKDVSKSICGQSDVDGKQTPVVVLSSTIKNAGESIQERETVVVTYIHSPSNFYIQKQHQSSSKVFQELSHHCKTHGPYHPSEVGELVAVTNDNKWCRAEVLTLGTYSADLLLIDYGYTVDNVDVKNIRALPLQFATALPKLAVCCALGGIRGTCEDGSYSQAAGRWFQDNYLEVPSTVIKVKRSMSSDTLLVSLMNLKSNKTARQSLLDYGMAVISTGTAPDIQPQRGTPCDTAVQSVTPTLTTSMPRPRFPDAGLLQVDASVCVVHVVSPADFYVLPADPTVLQKLKNLSEELQHYTTGYHPQYVGEPVAARFEGEWYRAEVVNMSNDSYEVFFVDFGNASVVGADDLHILDAEFAKWPKQAIPCGIEGVCGTDSRQQFTNAATEWFKNFCGGSSVRLSSVRITGRKHLVNISVDDAGVKEQLVDAGFARAEV